MKKAGEVEAILREIWPDFQLPTGAEEWKFLQKATQNLLQRYGADWIRRHHGLLRDQWEEIKEMGLPTEDDKPREVAKQRLPRKAITPTNR